MDAKEPLSTVAAEVRREFDEENRLLSFREWLDLFLESPYRMSRSAAQYVLDMFDGFGRGETAGGSDRLLLFDQEFRNGEGRVHGQEAVQFGIYRLVRAAARAGRTDKMILMHGPNGSGKSVIAEAIFHGLEDYSRQPEGLIYRFNWIFPKAPGEVEGLGFRPQRVAPDEADTYANLASDDIAARIVCEMRDSPLFLLPKPQREKILEAALEANPDAAEHSYRWVLEGELCQKCKGVYEGLLAGYRGDWDAVIRHVQVERWFFSLRYRSGAVTILPMASVDASEQQITADMSLQNLPPVLQNLKIFEPFGDLVDANGGVVEFGDFLKRPMDLNKYLLNAVEKGTIGLPNSLIHLNQVMLGTSNEKHLDHFKQAPEWTSFKGRIELVPVPYILQYREEAELYEDMISDVTREVHVTPHALEMAALWAVLTRLLPPDVERLEGRLAELAKDVTPFDKAMLYQTGEAPERLEREDRKILRGGADALRSQHTDTVVYEGRFGASAREMRMVLTRAAFDRSCPCLTPTAVFRALADLIRDVTVYDFLKLQPDHGYHESEAFIDQVSAFCVGLVREEFQDAMELIREEEYDRRFDEYMQHVVAFTRNEKIPHPQTGQLQSPNESMMKGVEELFSFEGDEDSFRNDLVGRIGAWAIDHPDEEVNFRALFPDLLRAVKQDFYDRRETRVSQVLRNLLVRGSDDFDRLPEDQRSEVDSVLANLADGPGYCPDCARDAAAFLAANSAP
ncbi:MAG: serine protein kinase PrkA [Planctomycetota bacterium]